LTSSASGRCSTPKQPEPTSRDRKAARPPKRVPGGAVDEDVRARCADPAPEALLRGIEQFNAGEFFDQHETLETLWRETRTPIRGLYHGILQIGVGFHHWRNGNHHGASVLMEEGIERLRPFTPACQGVDVRALIGDATRARDELLRLGPEGMRTYDLARAAKVRLTEPS
jgi:predicted metal-dependent hydrolase